MTILTHLLVTSVGIKVLGVHTTEDIWLAYLFGVAVDLDHLIKIPLYLKRYGLRKVSHYNWRTTLQEPVALLWIIPLSLYINSPIPAIFFSLHVLLDYSMSYIKMPFFPFSDYIFNPKLTFVSDKVKEISVILSFLCLNLFLK